MESNTVQTVTLTNSIIGVGILSMPFCFQKCGILLSIVLLILSTYITRLSCSYLLKSAIISRRKNFEQIGFYAFGTYGKLLVELCVVGYLLGTCIAYFVVVGDLGPQITAKIFSLNQSSTLRSWVMVVVTIVCIIPLGMLRNVDSLASVCTASLGFYLCLVLKVMSESFSNITKDNWFQNLDLWNPPGILQCLPIFSMSLSCQMQLFEVYATMPTASFDKMSKVVKNATNFCTSIYILIGFFGYVAFSSQKFSGNIIMNFSPSFVSDIIKIGFVLSVAFSFPLAIFPCRVSLYSLLYKRSYSDTLYYIPESKFKPLTISIVLVALMIGLLIPSIELVIGLVGSTIGVAICIIFPAMCYVQICKTKSSEKKLAQVMIVFGFLIMILGTLANLNAIDKINTDPYEKIAMHKEMVDPAPPKIVEIALAKEVLVTEKIQDTINVPNVTRRVSLKIEGSVKIDGVVLNPVIPETPKLLTDSIENKEKNKENINKDAILKEEREIAAEEKDKLVIEKEISELKSAKKVLQEQVNDMKQEIVKKNEETQQFVLKKIEEIAEKIEMKNSKIDEEPKIETVVTQGIAEKITKTGNEKSVINDLAKETNSSINADNFVTKPHRDNTDKAVDPIIKLLTDINKRNILANSSSPVETLPEPTETTIVQSEVVKTVDTSALDSKPIVSGKKLNDSDRIKRDVSNCHDKDLELIENSLRNNIILQEKEFISKK